jgi:hypothetical protein
MRSPREQEQFLERGRFGEGKPSPIRTAFSKPVIIGIGLMIFGASLLGIAALFEIGRDDGGPLFIMGWIVSSVAGLLCFLWALWGKLRRRLTRRT